MSSSPMPERKNYVIDTSVLAYHGESIHNFAGHNLYLPLEVLEELDNLKTRMDQVGSSCRYVNRYLDQLREKGSLFEGILLENQQMIYLANFSDINLLPESLGDTIDNRIISVAYSLITLGKPTTLVSRDISLRIRCDSLNIPAINYEKANFNLENEMFDGIETLEVSKEEIDEFYENDSLEIAFEKFYPNQGIILKSGKSSAISIFRNGRLEKLKYAGDKNFSMEGFSPRSKEQIIACELLLDPNVHMVSLTGSSGTGKTSAAICAAIKLLHDKAYKKIIISRPTQSTSKDIGYLPGDKNEKLQPWLQPIFDNIDVFFSNKSSSYIDMMMEKGIIEMEALTFIRGRTLPNTIFIIDEAQNITHHEAKAVLTRMGENSKIILIGDLEQIDSPHLDQNTSGLNSVVNLFKEFENSGHVSLKKGERSALANYACKVM